MSGTDKTRGYTSVISRSGRFSFTGDLDSFKEMEGFMTGQEWYDRFEEQLKEQSPDLNKTDALDALIAAKKAAGIK